MVPTINQFIDGTDLWGTWWKSDKPFNLRESNSIERRVSSRIGEEKHQINQFYEVFPLTKDPKEEWRNGRCP